MIDRQHLYADYEKVKEYATEVLGYEVLEGSDYVDECDASLKKIVAANQRKRAFYIPNRRSRSSQIAPIGPQTEPQPQPQPEVQGLDQKDDIIDNPQTPQAAPEVPTPEAG